MTYKRITFILLVFLMSFSILGGQQASASQRFVDVPTSLASYDEIEYLVEKGVIHGYSWNGVSYYGPNDYVTRWQVAKMVVAATGYEPLIVEKSSFTDVEVGTQPSGYVERAVQLGYFEKPANGKFNPDTPISRDEMSYVLVKALNLDITRFENATLPFSDISTNKYKNYINAIYFNGITVGYNGKYSPTQNVTREHFALFLARVMDEKFRGKLPVIGHAKVTTNGLNVRSTPDSSISNNLVGQVNVGVSLDVTGVLGNWLLVEYNGKSAYVFKTFTNYNPVEQISLTPEPVSTVRGRVTVNNLNVRAGAGTGYNSIGSLNRGDRIIVTGITNEWAKIKYGNQDGYVYKSYLKLLNQTGSVLKDRIIVLDPGHGGKDPGAVKASAAEKAIVLKVASLVNQKLTYSGAKVVMTRTGDTFPSLEERVNITAANYGELFVSIHANAASSAAAKGTETYYSVSTGDMYLEDIDLATFINNEIVTRANMTNRGVKNASYYVTRNMIIPSVLVELGFITNDADRAKLLNNEYVEIFAQSIYNGIVQYYSKQ